MSRPVIANCGQCIFYVEALPDPDSGCTPRRNGDGHCHRYAPQPLVGGSGQGWADWEWPSVRGKIDFCGEYVRK